MSKNCCVDTAATRVLGRALANDGPTFIGDDAQPYGLKDGIVALTYNLESLCHFRVLDVIGDYKAAARAEAGGTLLHGMPNDISCGNQRDHGFLASSVNNAIHSGDRDGC